MMSVWDSIIGQDRVVAMLKATAMAHPAHIAQSWLICGPPGSGRSNLARAFAAALQDPGHGIESESTDRTHQILAGSHPDVTTLATDKVTIGINEVRDLIELSEQAPSTAPWRIIIIEDVDRMLERTTNVLLKEIEEPSQRTIWLLCAPSAQSVLPTIRSRTRIVNLAVPANRAVADYLVERVGVERTVAIRAARLAQGHIGIAKLYATDERVMSDRDELVSGVLAMSKTSQAVVLAGRLYDDAKEQAAQDVEAQRSAREAQFRQINGLGERERIPASLRGAFNAIGKKEELQRRATRRSRDVLDRALNSLASVYRDVSVLHNNAEDVAGLVNLENRSAIAQLSVTIDRAGAVKRLEHIETARRRLAGNGNPTLVLEALFSSLLAS